MFITVFYVSSDWTTANDLTVNITLREAWTSNIIAWVALPTIIDWEYEFDFANYDQSKEYTYLVDFGNVPNRYAYGVIPKESVKKWDIVVTSSKEWDEVSLFV